jgi:hypothetical protein
MAESFKELIAIKKSPKWFLRVAAATAKVGLMVASKFTLKDPGEGGI